MINILCGIISPTEGSIKVFGHDSRTDRQQIAAITGICPQNDVLFNNLTVAEHLYFFGLLRNIPLVDIKRSVNQLISDLHLEHIRDQKSSTLSGGQKRKLCVAIAFVGNPILVVLDEMSSGVDPENRRDIWKFIQRKKNDCAILLCTHFMDEADFLTERKAMITKGQIACIGTSAYIKKVYKTGYTLSIQFKDASVNKKQINESFTNCGIEVSETKQTGNYAEYSLEADKIGSIAEWEKQGIVKDAVFSYSIKENGLEQIFSSKELASSAEEPATHEEEEELLAKMQTFVTPSFLRKTLFYGHFEGMRFLKNAAGIYLRLIVTLALTIIICVLATNNSTTIATSDPINFTEIANRLVLPDLKVTTNNPQVVANNPSTFVANGSTSDTIASLQTYPSYNVLTYPSTAIGLPFLAIDTLYASMESSITSYFQYTEIATSNVATQLIVISVLLSQLMYDLGDALTDDVCESKVKVKFLLLASGVPLLTYWIVTIARLILIAIPYGIAIAACLPDGFDFDPAFGILLMLQVVFFSAFTGTLFTKDSIGTIMKALRFLGVILMIVVPITQNKDAGLAFTKLSLIISPWLPNVVIFSFFTSDRKANTPSPSDFNVISAIHIAVYIVLLILVELRHVFHRNIPMDMQDPPLVLFKRVTKSFGSSIYARLKRIPRKIAVNDLTLEVRKNELFALLGPSGCGKTTTLNMLTAQQDPDKGSIYLQALHVAVNKLRAVRQIGFCPQFDDLLMPTMSVSDHLRIFCAMNGMVEAAAERYIDLLLKQFGIAKYKEYNCGDLSGGTMRKVSAIIAVMLPRSLVVLDEASTGLDPLARIKLWNAVRVLNTARTTIMTTHYINETSVCDRIAIMSDGLIKSCGNEHELTANHAKGYKATLRLKEPNQDLMALIQKNIFYDETANFIIEDVVGDVMNIHFVSFSMSPGALVSRVVKMKDSGEILSFTIGRMSLEHVFLELIKKPQPQQV